MLNHHKGQTTEKVGEPTKEQIESALCTALNRLKTYLDVPERSIAYAAACLPALAANIANATEHNALDKVFLVPKVVT